MVAVVRSQRLWFLCARARYHYRRARIEVKRRYYASLNSPRVIRAKDPELPLRTLRVAPMDEPQEFRQLIPARFPADFVEPMDEPEEEDNVVYVEELEWEEQYSMYSLQEYYDDSALETLDSFLEYYFESQSGVVEATNPGPRTRLGTFRRIKNAGSRWYYSMRDTPWLTGQPKQLWTLVMNAALLLAARMLTGNAPLPRHDYAKVSPSLCG